MLKFNIADEFVDNELNLFPDEPDLQGLKRLTIFKYFEDMNMLSDEEGGNLYLVNGSFTKLADAGAFANQNSEKEEKTE